MELIRRLASGRTAELLGTLDEGTITDDIVNRTDLFRRVAQQMNGAIVPGTRDRTVQMEAWHWGELHRPVLEGILPIPGGALDLPGSGDGDLFGRGDARPGDQHAVNVCNPGVADLAFGCGTGPMLRMCVELDPAGVKAYQRIPGGQVFARSSPHYADWLGDWLDHTPYYWAVNDAMVIEQAESHLVFTSP